MADVALLCSLATNAMLIAAVLWLRRSLALRDAAIERARARAAMLGHNLAVVTDALTQRHENRVAAGLASKDRVRAPIRKRAAAMRTAMGMADMPDFQQSPRRGGGVDQRQDGQFQGRSVDGDRGVILPPGQSATRPR